MLGTKKSSFGNAGNTTLLSRETVIVGDIHFSGNLDIEGLVQGNIIARSDKDAHVRVVQDWPMSATKVQKFVLRQWFDAEVSA